jgi:hypothetical protein
VGAVQHGYRPSPGNDQRSPAQGLFKQRLALEERKKLLWQRIPKNLAGQRTESDPVSAS